MIITKNDKAYIVTEQKRQWKLTGNISGVEVEYNVSKDICPNFEDLEQYVAKEKLF